MANWWVATAWEAGPAFLASWVFWVIVSIVLHELGHGWAALRRGDTTPADTGHMTWNPLVHMGPWSLAAFALIGIAWGAMPVDPTRMHGRRAEAFVAAAGPAVNVGLFFVCVVLHGAWVLTGHLLPEHASENLGMFLWIGAVLSAVLVLFNMLPIPPLDGSRILANFWPGYERLISTEHGMWLGFIAFVLMFFAGFDAIFGAGAFVAGAAFAAVEWVLP